MLMRTLVLLVLVIMAIVLFSSQTSFADTNTKSATLTVIKHVINDDGGTAKASDFTITVDHSSDVSASPSSFQGSETGTTVTLTGAFNILAHFTVHETSGVSDKYTQSSTYLCSTYINAGETLTCIITNDDNPTASKTSQTSTTPPSTSPPTTSPPTTSPPTTSPPTTSPPTTSPPTTSPPTTIPGSSSGSSTTSPTPPSNPKKGTATLIVEKIVKGGTEKPSDFTLHVSPYGPMSASPSSFPGSSSGTFVTLSSNQFQNSAYSVWETQLPNYMIQSNTCPVSDSIGINSIHINDIKICTITNVYVEPSESYYSNLPGNSANANAGTGNLQKNTATLIVKKIVDGGTANPSDFTLHVSPYGPMSASPSSFPGSSSGTTVTLSSNQFQNSAFSVWETQVPNYMVSNDCKLDHIQIGDTKECTITNRYVEPSESYYSNLPGNSANTGTGNSQTNTAKADFDLSLTHPTVTLEQGSGTYSSSVLFIDSTIEFPGDVKVDVSVDPPGLGVTADDEGYSTVSYPGTLQKLTLHGKYSLDDLLFVHVGSHTPPGTYHVNVKVSADLGDGVITKTITLTVIVTAPKTFSVSVSPNEITVVQGGSVNTDVTVTANEPHQYGLYVGAGNGEDLHSGLKLSFPDLPNPVSEGPYSHDAIGTPISAVPGAPVTTLTITAADDAPLGKHTIWVNTHSQVLATPITHDIYGNPIPPIFLNSNMYVPVTVNVVSKISTTSSSSTTNSAQQNYLIPSWVRNNAKWWSEGQTSDSDFASGIGYLVTNKIIKADSRGTLGSNVVIPVNMQIPSWIKNNANYWTLGSIDDGTFLQGIQYMLDNNIITFSTPVKSSPVTNTNQQTQLQKVIFYFVDADTGQPVDALVTIGGGITYMEKETQRDGSLEVSLHPGSYTITADADKYQRSTSTVEVKDHDLTTTISLKKFSSASTTQVTPSTTTPTIAPTITGANAVTIGKSYSASIPARAGMTYAWTVTGGSFTGLADPTAPSITFVPDMIGNLVLSCTEKNAAGDTATGSKTITVVPQPISPTITAPTTVTAGQSYAASVTPRPGMTYLWTINDGSITGPANTPSITFAAGTPGTLTLSATETNAAGDSSATGSSTVTVVSPPMTPQVTPPTTQTSLTVSISQTSASFIHNIGSSPCPTPITMVTLASSQQGSWQLTSSPSWISVILNGNQAQIGFNCQLQSYATQTLNGDVAFTFTSLDGHTASTAISITGQIHGQS